MNNKSHYEQLRESVAQQKREMKQKRSTNLSAGLRLPEQNMSSEQKILAVRENQFQPKTTKATSRVLFDPIKSSPSNTYRTGMGDTPVYIRPNSDHSHIKSLGATHANAVE